MKNTTLLQRLAALALAATLSLSVFAACTPQDTESAEGSDKESGGTISETVTDTDTGNTENSDPIPEDKEPLATGSVMNSKLGLKGMTAESSNPDVAIGTAKGAFVLVYAYTPGTATITVTDYFGFTAKIDVDVEEGTNKLTCTPIACETDFIEVGIDFGAKGNGTNDDTVSFQKALDAAKPGETVYVYPGRYPVSLLTMPEGVTLKMYTTMTDASRGFTGQIVKDFNNSKIAVLSGTRILNCRNNTPGRDGNSNFKIIGGAIDLNLKDRSTLIFGNASNVTVENVIFKDIKNNHVIQLTGCTDTVVKNCMFAGFVCGESFTREVVQVEPSAPGATGTAETAPITFVDGEYYLPKNITITDCYFGKSNEAGAPLMAIGHHSQVGDANVTNLKITNNVFDECIYAAIRYNNLVDAEITGNTFRSTSAYLNNSTLYPDAVEPAFIQFYHLNRTIKYNNEKGTSVIRATSEEQAGLHNIRIENNTFEIGKGSDKKVLRYVGNGMKPGVFYTSGKRQDTYLGETYTYDGYSAVTNYASNISFSDNEIVFTGKPTYSDWYVYLDPIYGLTYENNNVTLAQGMSFSKGKVINEVSDTGLKTVQVAARNSNCKINVVCGSQTYVFTAKATLTFTLVMSEGGALKSMTSDKNGNITVTFAPQSGYSFDKLTAADGSALSSNTTVTAATSYSVVFKK